MTWISTLSNTKKDEKIIEHIFLIGEIWWNGARKTNNHAVLGDLLEEGQILSDVSRISQRCLGDVSLPARCLQDAFGGQRRVPNLRWSWTESTVSFHPDYITTFHHFHPGFLEDFLMDSWFSSHLSSSWLLRFFLIRTTISAWKKPGGSRRQMSVTFQIGGETRRVEPSFLRRVSFLRHARRILKFKDI